MAQPCSQAPRLACDLVGEAATAALAARLAAGARPGDVLALRGDLGVGKSSFARAYIGALERPAGLDADEDIPSPTFTLVQTYDRLPAPVWHFDLYRLEYPEEVYELGIEEALAEGISLIEWPDRLDRLLPAGRLDLALAFGADPDRRSATLRGGAAWRTRLSCLDGAAPLSERRDAG